MLSEILDCCVLKMVGDSEEKEQSSDGFSLGREGERMKRQMPGKKRDVSNRVWLIWRQKWGEVLWGL